jgi:hypothetical protein
METDVLTLPTGKTAEDARSLIAKFQMSTKDAGNKYRDWVEKQKFVSKDLDVVGNLNKIKGVWVPVWLFEVSAESAWHGEVSHTESRNVIKEKERYVSGEGWKDTEETEDYDVYSPVSSTHYGHYLLPVSASRVIPQKEMDSLDFKKLDLKSYDESYLNGWQVQTTDMNEIEAKEICNELIKNREWNACARQVERLNGCSTKMTYETSNFALLPVFVLAYNYKDKPYKNLINGITGEVRGDKPPISTINKFGTYVAVAIGVLVFSEIGEILTGWAPIWFTILAVIILWTYYIYSHKRK